MNYFQIESAADSAVCCGRHSTRFDLEIFLTFHSTWADVYEPCSNKPRLFRRKCCRSTFVNDAANLPICGAGIERRSGLNRPIINLSIPPCLDAFRQILPVPRSFKSSNLEAFD